MGKRAAVRSLQGDPTMTAWHRLGFAAFASTLGIATACSSTGGTGGPGGPTGNTCGDYFDAVFAGSCNGPARPADEVARERALFLPLCANALSLPGEGVTASQLEACAQSLKSTGACLLSGVPTAACTFSPGTLGAGSACADSGQCASGDCNKSGAASDGGTTTNNACGVCTAVVAVGQPCTGGGCGQNAVCDSTVSPPVCAAVTFVDVGGSCNSTSLRCNAGLYCDSATRKCAAPGGAGTPCSNAIGQACSPPLVCAGTPLTCQNAIAEGGACQVDSQCASGLGCSTATHQCAAITWADGGQPCGATIRCKVGSCPSAGGTTSATCPAIIPDGSACNNTTAAGTCDVFSQCTGGVCVSLDTTTCK
jgi:hypothetical protein